jgi:hypothetical protein
MPIDLSSLGESLQRALGEIPPVAIALGLLAGPTLLFLGYRLIGITRRMQTSPEAEAEPFWVCHDCRSVNELRHTHCYRCGDARAAEGELEVIVEQPSGPPASFDVPAGSPFAAIAANPMQIEGRGIGVPVMGDPAAPTDAIAVGPGRSDHDQPDHAIAVPVVAEDGGALMLADVPDEEVPVEAVPVAPAPKRRR